MINNIGATDGLLRAILGIALIALVFIGPHTPWGWLGLVPLGTLLVGWCPLYGVMGWSTNRVKSTSV